MEKLCIFCKHFSWSKEEMWGMGSTMTGPMMEGGDANCAKGLSANWLQPHDEDDFRAIIMTAQNCKEYDQVKI